MSKSNVKKVHKIKTPKKAKAPSVRLPKLSPDMISTGKEEVMVAPSIDYGKILEIEIARQEAILAKRQWVEHKYPADWWQAVRERFFPKWWLDEWPVQYNVIRYLSETEEEEKARSDRGVAENGGEGMVGE